MRTSTKNTPRPRGRPKAYDPDVALDRATEVFWTKGFASTSLDDVAMATGMNRPSLYAAFGDKKALYQKTLQRFMAGMHDGLSRGLDNDRLDTALREAFDNVIEIYASSTEPRGCMVICTASAEVHDTEIKQLLETSLHAIDALFHDRLIRAKRDGELPQNCDLGVLSGLLGALLHSLALRARTGFSQMRLRKFAHASVMILIRGLANGQDPKS